MNKNFLTAKMGAHLIAAKVMQTGRDADVVAVSYGQWRVQTHNSLGDRVTIKPRTMVKGPTWQDKINVPDPSVSWWSDLPYKPAHGVSRNELAFDWHAAGRKVR